MMRTSLCLMARLAAVAISMFKACALLAASPAAAPVQAVREDSMRGLYEWYRRNIAPMPRPAPEMYSRYEWKELEPQRDRYDFSVIDKDIDTARENGQRIAFRVMPACSGAGAIVPGYLVSEMKNGVWFNDHDSSARPNTYFPDWNDPIFLDRTRHLVAALGKRYDGNPRIAWIEIGGYGNWGEWHAGGYRYPSPQGAVAGTADTKHAVIDMYLRAFRRTRLLMMTDDSLGVIYALSRSRSVGLRRDSLGNPHFENGLMQDPKRWAAMKDRWKTAPFIAEFYGLGADVSGLTGMFNLSESQVRKFHVSAVGNGNLPPWAQMQQDSRQALYALGDSAGYHLHVAAAASVVRTRRGWSVDVESTWTNSGSAPTYEPWSVAYLLAPVSGGPSPRATLGDSRVDLCSILPSPDGNPVTAHDHFALPKNLAPGQYAISVSITDPSGVRPPMTLDEPYALASFAVK